MNINDVFPSKYLKASDLQGRTVRVTIKEAVIEEIGQTKDRRLVIYFQGKEKGVVLNKTNANNIALMHGEDTDDWIGQEIELFEAMVDMQGKTVPAIRIRPVRAARTNAAPKRTVDNIGDTLDGPRF